MKIFGKLTGKASSLSKVSFSLMLVMIVWFVKVCPQHDLKVLSFTGFILSFQVALEHYLQEMYITITDVVGEKRIDLAYPIWNLNLARRLLLLARLVTTFSTR